MWTLRIRYLRSQLKSSGLRCLDPIHPAFPKLPGSHLPLSNPALEFVKDVCKVLALDRSIETNVVRLKSNLLKLLCVAEFSDEAEWRDPCLSFVIPEFICSNCNYTRDLDLCRDATIFTENNTDDNSESPESWRCTQCASMYNVAEIEQYLMDCLDRHSLSYVLQDVKCTKCQMVKMELMAKNCSCGGSFVNVMSFDWMVSTLFTFQSIGRFYRMDYLLDKVSAMLDGC